MIRKYILKASAVSAVFLLALFLITFYASAEEAPVGIWAEIKLENRLFGISDTDERFEFALTALDNGSPVPEEAEASVVGAGTASFNIYCDKPGVYKYTLKQLAGENIQWEYDERQYTVEVFAVYDKTGAALQTEIIYTGDEGYKTEPVFENIYIAHTPVPETGDAGATAFWIILLCFSVISGASTIAFIKNR